MGEVDREALLHVGAERGVERGIESRGDRQVPSTCNRKISYHFDIIKEQGSKRERGIREEGCTQECWLGLFHHARPQMSDMSDFVTYLPVVQNWHQCQ